MRRPVVAVAVLALALSVTITTACNGAELNAFRASRGLPALAPAAADRAAAAITVALDQAARRQTFVAQAHDVVASDLGGSWRVGCPVAPSALVRLTLSHLGFDGTARTGDLVVARRVALAVIASFRDLFVAGFPIDRMQPISAFGGDDEASMTADNTSAFNCRPVAGTSSWSTHAYGEAVDVNPLINPSVEGGVIDPPAGAAHADRRVPEPGKITAGSLAVATFARYGWGWGGDWSSKKDYQHFSSSGR